MSAFKFLFVYISVIIWDVWNYKNANYNHLNDLIRHHDWEAEINETLTVDESCENLQKHSSGFVKHVFLVAMYSYDRMISPGLHQN